MASASFLRKTVLFLLLAVFASPWASAAGRPAAQPGPAVSAPAPLDLLSSGWRFLTRLWSKEGCRIDSSGACQPLSTPATDTGCRIDPNGLCRS
jgi:hypothetical protein